MAQSLPPLHTRLGELRADLQAAHDALEEAATRWLETKAAGRRTDAVEAEIAAAERETRKLERKIHTAEKRRTK